MYMYIYIMSAGLADTLSEKKNVVGKWQATWQGKIMQTEQNTQLNVLFEHSIDIPQHVHERKSQRLGKVPTGYYSIYAQCFPVIEMPQALKYKPCLKPS